MHIECGFLLFLKGRMIMSKVKLKETVSEGSMSSVISELNKKITPKNNKKMGKEITMKRLSLLLVMIFILGLMVLLC